MKRAQKRTNPKPLRLSDGSRVVVLVEAPPEPRALPVPVSAARRQGKDTVYPPKPFDRRVNPKNPLWAGFRPRWLREAEKPVHIGPTAFEYFRSQVHCMSQQQCAAFLRVEAADIAKWEAGLEPIPYAAYMALRLAAELDHLPHQLKEWQDWQIIGAGPDVGKLYNTRTGEMFSPAEISTIRYVYADAGRVLRENEALKRQLATLQAEAERLRGLRQLDGIAGELEAMQARMRALLEGINQGANLDINRATLARTLQEVTP